MKLINCVNLIGDSLYSLKPLADYRMCHPDEDTALGIDVNSFAGQLIARQFLNVIPFGDVTELRAVCEEEIQLSAGRAARYAVSELLNHGRRLHISECYAHLLGGDSSGWRGDFRPLTGWVRSASLPGKANPYLLLAPFSRSCSRWRGMRPNKTPDHERWTLFIRWAEARGLPVKVLGSAQDVWTGMSAEKIEAESLQHLIDILTGASQVVSVDNGIGHIASALDCHCVILWPPISPITFIGPTWARNTTLLRLHPERVRADQLCALLEKELL